MAGDIPLPNVAAPAGRALAGAGIETLNDLVRWSEADLRALHGMGPKALGMLIAALAEHEMSLK